MSKPVSYYQDESEKDCHNERFKKELPEGSPLRPILIDESKDFYNWLLSGKVSYKDHYDFRKALIDLCFYGEKYINIK